MDKAPDAFRTISEVADEINVPQHVLRFWESRFAQIRPMKRGGGRRYYRPDDVDLLRGVRHLLYGEGYTIRGVQRILREEGSAFVQNVWRAGAQVPPPDPEDDLTDNEIAEEAAGIRSEPDLSAFALPPSRSRDEGDDPSHGSTSAQRVSIGPQKRPPGAVQGQLRSLMNELLECQRLLDNALQRD